MESRTQWRDACIRYGTAAKGFNWKEGHGVVGQRGIDFGSPELLSASALSVSFEYGVDAIDVEKDKVKGGGDAERRPGRRSHSQWVHISRNATLRRKWWRKRPNEERKSLVMHPRGFPVAVPGNPRQIGPGLLVYRENGRATPSPESVKAAL